MEESLCGSLSTNFSFEFFLISWFYIQGRGFLHVSMGVTLVLVYPSIKTPKTHVLHGGIDFDLVISGGGISNTGLELCACSWSNSNS